MRSLGALALTIAFVFSPIATGVAGDRDAALDAAIAGDHRLAEHKARDVYRHPYETLRFFKPEPGLSVAEIWPGGGWYTHILAPYLAESGDLTLVGFNVSAPSERERKRLDMYRAWMAERPEVYGTMALADFNANDDDIAPAGSLDRVYTFRNLHNWTAGGYADVAFRAFFKALKPGGYLGLVDHRLDEADAADHRDGYVKPSYAVALAEAAGFEFVGASEVNANAKDTRDHSAGVWTLPPRLRRAKEDPPEVTAGYVAIGESDRMTLLFRKPEG